MSEATVSSINERAAEEYYRRGLDSEQQGIHEKAVEFYERSLNENPDHEQAVFHLAVLYDRRADDAKAIELYERICTSPPVHLNALMNLAILYEDNNHYDEAHRCLDAVLRTDPNHIRARLYMKDVESARSLHYDDDLDGRGDRRSAILNVPVTDFELSVRSRNCLKKMNIRTLGDLLKTTEQELLSYKNFGETSLNEIKALLAQKSLRLGQAADESKSAVPARDHSRRWECAAGSPQQERRRSGTLGSKQKGAAAAQHQFAWRTGGSHGRRVAGMQEFRPNQLERNQAANDDLRADAEEAGRLTRPQRMFAGWQGGHGAISPHAMHSLVFGRFAGRVQPGGQPDAGGIHISTHTRFAAAGSRSRRSGRR